MTDPLLLLGVTSSAALVLRTALVELRWWLALRGTPSAERPAIIRARAAALLKVLGAPTDVLTRPPVPPGPAPAPLCRLEQGVSCPAWPADERAGWPCGLVVVSWPRPAASTANSSSRCAPTPTAGSPRSARSTAEELAAAHHGPSSGGRRPRGNPSACAATTVLSWPSCAASTAPSWPPSGSAPTPRWPRPATVTPGRSPPCRPPSTLCAPVEASPAAARAEVGKLEFLRGLGAHELDCALLVERRRFLAMMGRRLTGAGTAAPRSQRRYPILVTVGDEAPIGGRGASPRFGLRRCRGNRSRAPPRRGLRPTASGGVSCRIRWTRSRQIDRETARSGGSDNRRAARGATGELWHVPIMANTIIMINAPIGNNIYTNS